jgi:transposase
MKSKPEPSFTLQELEALLTEMEEETQEEGFTLPEFEEYNRDKFGTHTAKRRVQELVRAGKIKPVMVARRTAWGWVKRTPGYVRVRE